MKKAILHTLLVFVSINILLVLLSLTSKTPEDYQKGTAIVTPHSNGSEFLTLHIADKVLYYSPRYLHTYIFLKPGDSVRVLYKLNSAQTKVSALEIDEWWRKLTTIDKIVMQLILLFILFSLHTRYYTTGSYGYRE